MNYENRRELNSDHFSLFKSRRSDKSLKYFLDQINLDDYILIKKSGNFRIIGIEDIEKYAGVILFKKDEFDEDNFNLWVNWIKNNILLQYLNKPFPSFDPYKKLKELI